MTLYDSHGHRISAYTGDDSVLVRPGKEGRGLRALYGGAWGNLMKNEDAEPDKKARKRKDKTNVPVAKSVVVERLIKGIKMRVSVPAGTDEL